ncbi:sodium/pantothenate symporter [Lentibacillus daqui]|uniref:sodium/pantothenate symporter n=1 Tax=Lentibacillus daqui TaxID=2911514 RepID=UPI0022B0D849|nr:sodium/pantothenate symporter [Lentibacillus daqui]
MNWEVIIILILYLIAMFLIGVFSSKWVRKSSDFTNEYFLGGRQLGGFVLAMTMFATYASASSFLGGPGAAYTFGLAWVLLSMTQLVTGYFTLSILGKKFAIMARKINAVTLVDFLKERYRNKWVVILSAICIVVFLFALMAAQWVGGGHLMESVMGIPYVSGLFVFGMVLVIYTVIGGFRAVAITDTIQGVIMLIGSSILVVAAVIAGGGINNIMSGLISENPNLVSPFGSDQSLSPAYVSSYWVLVGVGVVGLPQIAVRAISYRSSKSMHSAIMIGTFAVGFVMLVLTLTGVFARVIMPEVSVADNTLPLLALELLPPWLVGIVLAGPLAAIMSTVSSVLLVASSSIIKDIYLNYVKPDATSKTVQRLSYGVTTIIGVIVFFMAIKPPSLLIWLNLFAMGGLEAAFIWPIVMGLYWKTGNSVGALSSILTGVIAFICFNTFISNPFGLHPVVISVILSFLAYVFGSLFTKKRFAAQRSEIVTKFWSA